MGRIYTAQRVAQKSAALLWDVRALWDPGITSTVNAGAPVDTDPIDTVADSVGGFTLTKFSDPYRPTYRTNQLDGRPCIRYAGATQCIKTGVDVIGLSTWTIIMVAKGNAPAGVEYIHSLYSNGTGFNGFLYTGATPTGRWTGASGTSDKNAGAGWFDSTPHTIFHTNDGTHAGHLLFKDNATVSLTNGTGTANPGIAVTSRQFFLGCSSGIASPVPADFFKIAIVGHALSSEERAGWQASLKAQFPSLP